MRKVIDRAYNIFTPPPNFTPSQWADKYRYLSRESSAQSGKYRTAFAPYQREPMDAVMDNGVQSVCLMFASQTGKTEIVNNLVAFFIDAEPAPILVVQPTLAMGETWSKDRLTPMCRDTPKLAGLIKEARTRDSGNTLLSKTFPGGNIAIAGANSPAGLASRPRRVVIQDEIDRYPVSAGTEGDPCKLADRRAESFWNAVFFKTSTPTIKHASRIESEFELTDKRKYFVPCPYCGELQILEWKMIRFDSKAKYGPENAYIQCVHCAAHWNDDDRLTAIRSDKGEWRSTAEFNGKRGYFLNGIYSPFPHQKGYQNRLHMMVMGFLDVKGKREQLKTWTNTFLAETWEEKGDTVEGQPLFNRREKYTPDTLPVDVLAVTAAVDVQANRLEFERVGWGDGLESWGIEYGVIFGNPKKSETWAELDRWILQTVKREDGAELPTACVCIDSGHLARETYKFTTPRQIRRVFAVKGTGAAGHPLVKKSQMKGQGQLALFMIGTGEAKDDLFAGLGLLEPGPSYAHFPVDCGYDTAYFEMLTAEVCRSTYRNGQRIRKWELKAGSKRNESLDIRVYNRAAIHILNPNFERIRKNILKNLANSGKSSVSISKSDSENKETLSAKRISRRRSKKAFASSW